ncbi:hypothetical protein [Novosphingobium sp. MBES04]|uniref:hypothetical protein n=1 Tax=Novosphingobium sp. MBES04 TaxID=1206458 RepID=UPI000572F72B|nr:hypothetical protein [Novosphingobium sp. MBES04]GAM07689.1 hypothetical protein MBENS4_4685 [Novosphingobium sp. MBES04]
MTTTTRSHAALRYAELLRDTFASFATRFEIADTVIIDLRNEPAHLADELGDDIVLWRCRRGIRAKRLDRHELGIVKFGFEHTEDAQRLRDTLWP